MRSVTIDRRGLKLAVHRKRQGSPVEYSIFYILFYGNTATLTSKLSKYTRSRIPSEVLELSAIDACYCM